jgi:uncharacterized phage-associated protein
MSTIRRTLERKRLTPLRRIVKLACWMEGSLVSTTRKCGKRNCACHQDGPKHPVMYLTWKENGKTVSLYIPRKLEKEVKMWVDNYKKVKELVREVSSIQKQIVRLRDNK